MSFNPVPKPNFKRGKPTRKERGEFDKKTKNEIVLRDGGRCRVCKNPYEQIHHTQPKGSGRGRGVFTNGMCVCQKCHREIHDSPKKMRKWKEVFSELYGPNYYKDEYDV